MKKAGLFIIACLLFLPSTTFAQQVEVILIKGKVHTRSDERSKWQKPEEGQILEKNAEIKTGFSGKCVIAFDREKKNTVTIEKRSRIKIENIVPGSVFLPKGRVFTLIRNIDQVGDFKVKTPTAVTGARGTGWVTEFENGITSVSVFEDNVFVTGLDDDGFAISQIDVKEEYQTHISPGGAYHEPEKVSEAEKHEWNNEIQTVEYFISDHEKKMMRERRGPYQPGSRKGDYVPGPEEQKHMQDMITKMRDSGDYTEEQIQRMEQAMTGDMYDMSPGAMIEVMQTMDQMNELYPDMQAMMKEMIERQDELEGMSPQEIEAAIHEMEERHGVGYGDDEYYGPGHYEMSGEFLQHMQDEYGFQPSDQPYDYGSDTYFGEFDYVWDSATGLYVSDYLPTLTEEQYNTVLEQAQQDGFTCECPFCHPDGSPEINCP